MWAAMARAAIYLVAITFLMWVLRRILDPIISMATAGPHADAASVTRVGGYFGAMTLDNLTLLGALAVAIFLLGRAAVEQRV